MKKIAIYILFALLSVFLALIVIWFSNQRAPLSKERSPYGPVGLELQGSIEKLSISEGRGVSCKILVKQIITVICDNYATPFVTLNSLALEDKWKFKRIGSSPIYEKSYIYLRDNDALMVECDKNNVVRMISITRSF